MNDSNFFIFYVDFDGSIKKVSNLLALEVVADYFTNPNSKFHRKILSLNGNLKGLIYDTKKGKSKDDFISFNSQTSDGIFASRTNLVNSLSSLSSLTLVMIIHELLINRHFQESGHLDISFYDKKVTTSASQSPTSNEYDAVFLNRQTQY